MAVKSAMDSPTMNMLLVRRGEGSVRERAHPAGNADSPSDSEEEEDAHHV